MSHKMSISIGMFNVPIQAFSSLAANVIIINNISKGDLDIWYLLVSTIPLFTALELSFPSLMLKNINKKARTNRAIREYLYKAIFLSSIFQISAIIIIMKLLKENYLSWYVLFFFLGMYLRAIANVIISVPYSVGLVSIEKIYRLSSATLMPMIIIALYSIFNDISCVYLYFTWLASSVATFLYSICAFYTANQVMKNEQKQSCDASIPINLKDNLSLLVSTIPGLFIFNLSIYYLKVFYNGEGIVIYGLILQLVNIYYLVNSILPSVLAPSLSSNFFSGKKISENVLTVVDCNIFIAFSSFLFIFLLGDDFLLYFFSEALSAVEIRLILIAVSMFILVESIQVTLTFFGISTGKYNYHYQSLASAILVTSFSYFLIPLYGYMGLVYSICLAQAMTCLFINSYIVCKHLEINPADIYIRFALLSFLFSCLFIVSEFMRSQSLYLDVFIFCIILSLSFFVMYKLVFYRIVRIIDR
ncbi:hypothetical protein ID104_11835 [Vibrio cholerae]|nr:hypothetical protein [Vibrio cholerae]TXZ56565.1 hypothetical protein FXE56_03890 [Vibrio cholerae]